MTQTSQTNGAKNKQFDRIGQVEVDGRVGWRKEPETLSLSLRLRKGDPAKGFEREKATYIALQGKGLPIPELLDSGDGFFVIADAGTNLNRVRMHTIDTPEVFHRALSDGATALARLHSAGYCHGRPALRDICWEDGCITFIDLDRTRPGTEDGRCYGLDILIFFFNTIAQTGGVGPEVLAAREAYRAADTTGNWQHAVARAKRLRPLAALLSPLSKKFKKKREFRSIQPTIAFFTSSD
ncbi:hypothetical protein [uncultured Shimia sp.]|uniref:hypothetical protein n=1 Tax=uncultured Shimia sp. TaxID=573152 RepID=UPI0026211826|nr:hypothetical protein [uncultured Shimia sp.]